MIAEGFAFALLRRSLSYSKPTLFKGSARRAVSKRKAAGFSFGLPEPQPTLSKVSDYGMKRSLK